MPLSLHQNDLKQINQRLKVSNFHFQVNEMLGGRSVSQWAERWMGAPPLAAGKYTRVMCHWSAEWMWPATAAMRGLFLSRYSSEEIYDQRPEDGGAAGDGVKFFRFFSPPVDLFLQWTKKKMHQKGQAKKICLSTERLTRRQVSGWTPKTSAPLVPIVVFMATKLNVCRWTISWSRLFSRLSRAP